MGDSTRAAYDAVAYEYEKRLADELDGKPLDRGLLAAFVELAGDGVIADVGCGPGHVAGHLAGLGAQVVGVDLSPAMIEIAQRRHPAIAFHVGSMLALPAADSAWAGAVLLYSIIHLAPEQRARAYAELARVIRPGGPVLLAFHVTDAEHAAGDVNPVREFLGQPVELTHYYLAPDDVAAGLAAAGFLEVARLEREPNLGAVRAARTARPGASASTNVEYPSRRCYLIARRGGD